MRKKVMLPLLALGMSFAAGTGHAEDNVLFKLQDIVPVKNADGLVVSCDLGATFYNRSNIELSAATLTLVWHDDVVADTIDQEQRNERENRRLKKSSTSRYKTSDLSKKEVRLTLKLPPLKPHQQVSLKSKVATERCFLLLNDVDIRVSNCRTNSGGEGGGRSNSNANCQDLFKFVTTSNPEYYSEFKKVSDEDLQSAEYSQIEQKKNDLQSLYNDSLNEINRVTSNFNYTKETQE